MGNKLYVGNLSYNVRDDDLQQAFAQYGTVTSAKVMMDRDTGRSKGFGFVEMGSDPEAQAAINGMNGQALDGRAIVVNEARPREERPGGFGGGGGGGWRRWRRWRRLRRRWPLRRRRRRLRRRWRRLRRRRRWPLRRWRRLRRRRRWPLGRRRRRRPRRLLSRRDPGRICGLASRRRCSESAPPLSFRPQASRRRCLRGRPASSRS